MRLRQRQNCRSFDFHFGVREDQRGDAHKGHHRKMIAYHFAVDTAQFLETGQVCPHVRHISCQPDQMFRACAALLQDSYNVP